MADEKSLKDLFAALVLGNSTAQDQERALRLFNYDLWHSIGRELKLNWWEREATYLVCGMADAQYPFRQVARQLKIQPSQLRLLMGEVRRKVRAMPQTAS